MDGDDHRAGSTSDDDAIRRLRAQLVVVAGLLDEAEECLRAGVTSVREVAAQPASDPAPAVAPPPGSRRATEATPPPVGDPLPPAAWRGLLTGPHGLAIVGGSVLVLGLAFLYIVASQQGILGPTGRTVTGALVSLVLIGAGVVIERRDGGLVGAVAAIGAGIAGLFLALVAATRIFDLIPGWLGLVLAGAVAAFAVAVAISWRSQWVAGFGLCGALAAPVFVDAGITPGTVAFVLVLAAAVAVVWLALHWHGLAVAGGALSSLYLLALVIAAAVVDRDEVVFGWNDFTQGVLGAGLFWVLAAGVAMAHHRLWGADEPAVTVQLTIGAGALAVAATSIMFHPGSAGWPLLVVAGVYALLCTVPRLLRRPDRLVTVTLLLIALAAVFLATVDLLDASSRATALALQGGALAMVAARFREVRLQIAAAGYLAVAALAAISQAAPVADLFRFPPEQLVNDAGTAMDGGATLGAIIAVVVLAAGALVLAWAAERLEWGERIEDTARPTAFVAAVAVLYAIAGAIVFGALAMSFERGVFQGAHAIVSIVLGVGALAILVVGLRRRESLVRKAGLALLGVTLAKLLLFDLSQLTALSRAVAFVAVGALFVAGSIAFQRFAVDDGEHDDEGGAAG